MMILPPKIVSAAASLRPTVSALTARSAATLAPSVAASATANSNPVSDLHQIFANYGGLEFDYSPSTGQVWVRVILPADQGYFGPFKLSGQTLAGVAGTGIFIPGFFPIGVKGGQYYYFYPPRSAYFPISTAGLMALMKRPATRGVAAPMRRTGTGALLFKPFFLRSLPPKVVSARVKGKQKRMVAGFGRPVGFGD